MYFEIYKDKADYWRWRLKSENHKIIAVSSESYWHKSDCLHSIGLVKTAGVEDARVDEV